MFTDDNCNVLMESLNGARPADEQTFMSINVLADRLQAVKKSHRNFIDVDFSPHVQALIEQESILAIS